MKKEGLPNTPRAAVRPSPADFRQFGQPALRGGLELKEDYGAILLYGNYGIFLIMGNAGFISSTLGHTKVSNEGSRS